MRSNVLSKPILRLEFPIGGNEPLWFFFRSCETPDGRKFDFWVWIRSDIPEPAWTATVMDIAQRAYVILSEAQ